MAGCGGDGGVPKHAVRGIVTVNGQPAERVAVQLHATDPAVTGNLRYPTGLTNSAGEFVLSTEGEDDGAVAGEYIATFTWLSSPEIDAFDMFRGAFGDPAKSEHRLTVPQPTDAPARFDLQIPEARLKRPAAGAAGPP